MRIRIAAIGVGHWHSLYDSAYLRHAVDMPDVELVGLHDPDPEIAAKRAVALGGPPVFTDYREMLARTRPDFVIALGRHRAMAETAHHLLDERYPFLFNSYYEAEGARHARPMRGMLTRPGLQEVLDYRHHVEAAIDTSWNNLPGAALALLELGINHEQQHQE